MSAFGDTSKARLETCHPLLQKLFNEVILEQNCTVLCGRRTKEDQDAAYLAGTSKVQWPESMHNVTQTNGNEDMTGYSLAVDVAPYPVDWNDRGRFYMFIGRVLSVAHRLKIGIRSGGDWNRNGQSTDQNFHDLPHFELVK